MLLRRQMGQEKARVEAHRGEGRRDECAYSRKVIGMDRQAQIGKNVSEAKSILRQFVPQMFQGGVGRGEAAIGPASEQDARLLE
jgi:hypothetical protein